jgi:DNA helicase-2/ATP-dependent DNA helicase PcrA
MPLSFDENQREAIEHVQGPMLVIAGAGTGKTTVLVERIANLIQNQHADPAQILALTYTDNSTDELIDRVARRLRSAAARDAQVRNFHTYSLDIMKRLGCDLDVLEEPDLWIFLRQRIAELPLKSFIRAANVGEFLFDFIQFFERCHDELVTPARYDEYLARVERGELPLPRVHPSSNDPKCELTREEILERCHEIAQVFHAVEQMLADAKLWTFSHMILRAVEALEQNPELLRRERERARFMLLDEFQDVNYAQIRLARMLAGDDANIFAVGDPDQAIYYFRGASSAAFAQFLKFYPHAKVVRFSRNRRSLPPILHAAHALIAANPAMESAEPQRQPLISVRAETEQLALSSLWNAQPVNLVGFMSKFSESADIADRIEVIRNQQRCRYSDFAVLYRSHYHREELVRELSTRDIPFAVVGMDVLETPEVRDLVAALRVVNSPSDSVSLFRLAALRQFTIDPKALRRELAAVPEPELTRILQQFAGGAKLLEALEAIRADMRSKNMPARAVVDRVLAAFDIPQESFAVHSFREFVAKWQRKKITKSKSLAEFLRYFALFLEADGTVPLITREVSNSVQLMTAHAAKGLEFRHVFIMRATKPSFPSKYREPLFEFPPGLRAPDSAETTTAKELHHQEERRLFYVAMTRARDTLSIYGALRGKNPAPAGYMRELHENKNARGYVLLRRAAEPRLTLHAATEAVTPLADWLLAPAEFKVDDLVLSASAITDYRQCPLKYKIDREWCLPGKTSAAMQFGNAMHTALKFFGEHLNHPWHELLAEVGAVFHKALDAAAIEDATQRRLYEEQGTRQLTQFIALHAGDKIPQVLATERGFVIEIGNIRVRGRVDRLDQRPDGAVDIIDYKTGSPRTQEDADDSLQLSLYALGAERAWNLKPARLIFYNLESNSEIVTTRTPEQLVDAEAQVEAVAGGIAAGNFEPNPGQHCARCGYNSICPTQERSLVQLEPSVAAAGKVN